MNLDKALDIVAEYLNAENYYDMEKKLLDAVKKRYGIEDLYFFTGSNWFYCSTEDPTKTHWIINHPNLDHDTSTHEILGRIISLIHGKWSTVYYDGKKFNNLADLKEYHLTKKLAGI